MESGEGGGLAFSSKLEQDWSGQDFTKWLGSPTSAKEDMNTCVLQIHDSVSLKSHSKNWFKIYWFGVPECLRAARSGSQQS